MANANLTAVEERTYFPSYLRIYFYRQVSTELSAAKIPPWTEVNHTLHVINSGANVFSVKNPMGHLNLTIEFIVPYTKTKTAR